MKTKCVGLLVVLGLGLILTGCVTAPERIDVRVGSDRPKEVDSSRVPRPRTLDEAQQYLNDAYANLQYLERENERLQRKAAEYKRERDECEDRLERYEDD